MMKQNTSKLIGVISASMPRRQWLIAGLAGMLLIGCMPSEAVDTTQTPTEEMTMTEEPTTQAENNSADADVIFVRARHASDGTWTFEVTLEHPDTGWEDYTDGWDVVTPDGTVLKANPDDPFTRLLLHPHVEEQPFTRSQSGIVIPEDVTEVSVRAHDLVSGYGGLEVIVNLNQSSGPGFEIIP